MGGALGVEGKLAVDVSRAAADVVGELEGLLLLLPPPSPSREPKRVRGSFAWRGVHEKGPPDFGVVRRNGVSVWATVDRIENDKRGGNEIRTVVACSDRTRFHMIADRVMCA
ncbi:hypothetical protein NL676_003055 [Syzygium grande]|nr:hypothetical protein NL676_003055 [Syzygium grande]